MRGEWFSFESRYIKTIPMPKILASKELEKLTTTAIKEAPDLSLIKPQIDRLVYELYELTEEEIEIVEGETG